MQPRKELSFQGSSCNLGAVHDGLVGAVVCLVLPHSGLEGDFLALLSENLGALVDDDVAVTVAADVEVGGTPLAREAHDSLHRNREVQSLLDGADEGGGDILLFASDGALESAKLTVSKRTPLVQRLEYLGCELVLGELSSGFDNRLVVVHVEPESRAKHKSNLFRLRFFLSSRDTLGLPLVGSSVELDQLFGGVEAGIDEDGASTATFEAGTSSGSSPNKPAIDAGAAAAGATVFMMIDAGITSLAGVIEGAFAVPFEAVAGEPSRHISCLRCVSLQ